MNKKAAGVTFVVPVLNAGRWLRPVVTGIVRQRTSVPIEILVVDDGSTDGSRDEMERLAAAGTIAIIDGPRRGAAAAINVGIRHARYPIVCQVDQDVMLQDTWLQPLLDALDADGVAAAQGRYVTASDAGFWARATGRDLEHRYSQIGTAYVDHVCTGNTAYRVNALMDVGLLDERLGYGYDNDLSYRLAARGYRLAFCRDAVSVHRWREGLRGFLLQQFGVGYGRLDVVARHVGKAGGDDVSGLLMILHGPAFIVACAAALWAFLAPSAPAAALAIALLAILSLERLLAGIGAWRHTGDRSALVFPLSHLLRDAAWGAAILAWLLRRAGGWSATPQHSMPRRASSGGNLGDPVQHSLSGTGGQPSDVVR